MAKIILRAGKVAIKIILLFAILGLIFFSIKKLNTARAQSELSVDDEFALAEDLQEQGQYAEAEEVYLGIIEEHPLTTYDLEATTQLAILYIDSDRSADANSAVEELKSNFYEHPGISQALYDIADCYGEVQKNYEKSRWLYQYVLANWPHSESAIWSQADIAVCSINLKDELEADAAIKQLLTDFSASENIVIAVYEIANCYSEEHKNYEKARQLCQLAVDNWPESKYTILARAGVISARIALGNDTNAQEVVDALLKQFSESEFIGEAACSIAYSYFEATEYENARKLYKIAADNWSGNDDAIWAQAGLISTNIYLGDDPNVAEAIDVLLERFSENKFIDEVACSIADSFYGAGDFQEARRLYQYDVDNYPGAEGIMWAKAGIIRTDIALDAEPNVTGKLDELTAEYNFHPYLPEAILEAGLAYYTKACLRSMAGDGEGETAFYRDAIRIDEMVIDEFGESEFVGDAYFRAGVLYAQELGEYQKGIDYFQAAIDSRTNYEFSWAAQFLIGEYYEKLRDSGAIEQSEANAKAKAAYEAVLEDYPDSYWAEQAQLQLNRIIYREYNREANQ